MIALAAPAFADGDLGRKDPGLYNLKGTIYELPEGTDHMPEDLSKMPVMGVIYTDRLDVPPRSFEEGFPGVTDRYEWFGIVYTGTLQIDTPGTYAWHSITDDGIILWIDGKEVMRNDSIHAPADANGEVTLAKGTHSMKVWYFQGPASQIALQLFVTIPKAEEKLFVISDFQKGLSIAYDSLKATATADGIKVDLDASVLFDSGKDKLKPAGKKTLAKLATILASYPDAHVRIEGHTDSQAADDFNQKLSERRAAAVAAALKAAHAPKTLVIEAVGFGETRPIADNATEEGRAKNRRVEIYIKP
ncbi:MAG TPA: OmpA family protein [Kofleriaceae bacterium]|nr:OmpA family protein [Kofleriaceae bacterium]